MVGSFDFKLKTLLSKLQANPSQIKIAYKFHPNDPVLDYATTATKITQDGATLNITPQRALPRRPEKYQVKISFPIQIAKDSLVGNLTVPVDSPTFDVTGVAI